MNARDMSDAFSGSGCLIRTCPVFIVRVARRLALSKVDLAVALIWLWKVDGVPLTRWDLTDAIVALAGMGIIVAGGFRI